MEWPTRARIKNGPSSRTTSDRDETLEASNRSGPKSTNSKPRPNENTTINNSNSLVVFLLETFLILIFIFDKLSCALLIFRNQQWLRAYITRAISDLSGTAIRHGITVSSNHIFHDLSFYFLSYFLFCSICAKSDKSSCIWRRFCGFGFRSTLVKYAVRLLMKIPSMTHILWLILPYIQPSDCQYQLRYFNICNHILIEL